MKAIDTVTWMPEVGKNRISPMIEGRSDWCISRQRSWGVPIPVFYQKETGEALMTEETIAHVTALVREKGSDAWFELDEADLLPPSLAADAAATEYAESCSCAGHKDGRESVVAAQSRATGGKTFVLASDDVDENADAVERAVSERASMRRPTWNKGWGRLFFVSFKNGY